MSFLPGCGVEFCSWIPAKKSKTENPYQLSVRARKAMIRMKVSSIEQLTKYTLNELVAIKNVGPTTASEFVRKLRLIGLSLKGE
jgi:DNA-directed RNA polymerase alpha subunit